MKKFYFILFIISILALWPFFKKGYFESHDGEWMVIRFSAFHQNLTSGQFPVRFVDRLNNNYGYPVINFLYPLPFYLAEIPKVLGFGFVDSIKIIFVTSTAASMLAMFWALAGLFTPIAAFSGAVIYLYAPYRLVDLYVRGSLGESVAFLFVPLLAGCIFKVAKGDEIYFPATSVFTALLILSHNVSAILFLPFFVILGLLLTKGQKKNLILSLALGIMMASFFWVPAILDLRYVLLSQIKVSEIINHLVSLEKIIIPSWGYGPNPNSLDGLSTQLGIVTIIILVTTLLLRISGKTKDRVVDLMFLAVVFVIFLMTKYSSFIWLNLPALDIIQFPWRLLSLVVFTAAFLSAFIIDNSSKKKFLAAILTIVAIISTTNYRKPSVYVDKGDSYYSTNEDTTNVRDEYLPLWVQEKPKVRASSKIEIIEGDVKVLESQIKPTNYKFSLSAKENSTVQINTIYFPGYEVKIDNILTKINFQNKFGLINFQLPKGNHQVIIRYGKTPVHLASEIASVLTATATGIYFLILWKKQNF